MYDWNSFHPNMSSNRVAKSIITPNKYENLASISFFIYFILILKPLYLIT